MEFIKKICKKCGILRKFRVGAANDSSDICGNCFDWVKSSAETFKQ